MHGRTASYGLQDGGETRLLTATEVAHRFRVDTKTVRRWARNGKLSTIRTPGGHQRFLAEEVEALLRRVDEN